MNEKDRKPISKQEVAEEETARLAYMVAWRDRYIQRLEEMLHGREEAAKINLSLLGLCLRELSSQEGRLRREERDGVRILHLPKSVVREALESCYAAVEQDDAEYRILFLKDGGERADDRERQEA